MTQVDSILDVIDAGLQSSSDHGYGTDHRPEACARCQRHDPVEGGDLCEGCRAFLLGDVDEDPRYAQPPLPQSSHIYRQWTAAPYRTAWVRIQVDTDGLVSAINRMATSLPTAEQWQAMADRFQEAWGVSAEQMMASAARVSAGLGTHAAEPIFDECSPPPPSRARALHCPRHGQQPPGGHCRVCVRQANRQAGRR